MDPVHRNKICIITPSLRGGGAEKVAVNLANFYAKKLYAVDLVVLSMVGPYHSMIDEKVTVVDLKVRRIRYGFFRLRKYIRNNRNCCVLSVKRDINVLVGLASFFIGANNLVYREANTLDAINVLPTVKRFFAIAAMKVSYVPARRVIANSDRTKSDLTDSSIVAESKVVRIVNPVLGPRYESLSHEPINHEWLTDPAVRVVLGVGRLHIQKDFTSLIVAFSKVIQEVANARLVIIGEGPEHYQLKDTIDRLGLNQFVKIEPFKENILPYFRLAAVFALSSRWEGFGNVIVEAMAVGTPVVCTACPGGPEMILRQGELGRLVPLGNVDLFANALIDVLCSEKDPRRSLIEEAKKYSVENVAIEYLRVLTEASV